MVFDVAENDFQERVVDRSHELPVIVDFWAEWCGPCRALSPALEAEAGRHEGEVELAKVDVDTNQMLARAFGIRGIPAVKAFRGGRVVDEFTGAIPPAQVAAFFERVLPSPADRLADAHDEESLRRALELDPRHVEAARSLARMLVARGSTDEARRVLEPVEGDFIASGMLARLELAEGSPTWEAALDGTLERAFAAWDSGDHANALDALQGAVAGVADPQSRDLLRRVMVAIFTELGPEHPLAREHRRRLAGMLS